MKICWEIVVVFHCLFSSGICFWWRKCALSSLEKKEVWTRKEGSGDYYIETKRYIQDKEPLYTQGTNAIPSDLLNMLSCHLFSNRWYVVIPSPKGLEVITQLCCSQPYWHNGSGKRLLCCCHCRCIVLKWGLASVQLDSHLIFFYDW